MTNQLPLLPLILDRVPPGLVRALEQEGIPFSRRAESVMEGRFVLFDSSLGPCRPLCFGQKAIDVDSLREDHQPDPFEQLLDVGAERHSWQIAGLSLSEEISRVDRRDVRRRLLGRLRERIERAGGIWLSVGAFPFPYRSALNVRIDYDQYDADDFAATLDALAGEEEATTHFVNAAAYLHHDEALARLEGLDVGSHGYRHHTYLTEKENRLNVGRGIETLRVLGIEPSGFAAPGGRFGVELAAALESLGVGHSSEFGLAFDELPFSPNGGHLLQVPVHPVCLGLFLETVEGEGARRNSATQQAVRASIDYFRQTARDKYHAGEPVFFYGHPTGRLGRYPQVLRAIFDTADQFGAIWKTTLSEFARWWRARADVRLSVVGQPEQYMVTASGLPAGYRVAVEFHHGQNAARMPLAGRAMRFSPSALAYESRPVMPGVRPVRVDGPEGLRGRVRRMIDWELETPVEEIPRNGWRNWAKRTLRRLRS